VSGCLSDAIFETEMYKEPGIGLHYSAGTNSTGMNAAVSGEKAEGQGILPPPP